MLPFNQAIKLPVTVTHRTNFGSLIGKIEFTCPVSFALVKFWDFNEDFMNRRSQRNLIINRGIIRFHGKADFGFGVTLNVAKNGIVEFGEKIMVGAKNKIICENYISFGKEARIAFESQVIDTNFHYYKSTIDNNISKRNGSIIIGNYNQIANRCSVMKGTITPDYSIFGSNSLLNKDYTKIAPEYSLLGGMPAKLIKIGIVRVWDYEEEYKLNTHFNLEL
jgi:acetyltransferase-like isoleucine patch superfamily enzyme